MPQLSQQASTIAQSTESSARWLAVAVPFLFGAALIFITGFAHPQALHDAAHDTRHALSFPCH